MNESNIIQEYFNDNHIEANSGLSTIVSILLFGGVIIFILIYVYTFIKATKNSEETGLKNINEYDNKLTEQNICKVCGMENDYDARFCKNCGSKLY